MRVQIHAILQRDFQNTAYRRCEMNGFYKLSTEIIASLARSVAHDIQRLYVLYVFSLLSSPRCCATSRPNCTIIIPLFSTFSFTGLFNSTRIQTTSIAAFERFILT